MAMTITAAVTPPRYRAFYVALSLCMALIAVVGFWPTYFGPLVWGTLAQPLLIHVHAVVFTGWLALFAAQVVLAATRRIRWHLWLGKVGIAYGIALIVVGLVTTALRAAARPEGGERLLYIASLDMVIFAAFFGMAIWYRRKPQLHKRLMIVAATTLLVAAVGRMTFLPPPPGGLPIGFLLWSSPVLMAMIYDWRQKRLLYPVYIAGLAAFAVRVWSVPVAGTEAWGAFAGWVFEMIAG
jgi:hypothetical protein